MKQNTDLNEGICITLFVAHRINGTPLSLRSDYDSLIILSDPANDSDHRFIESKVEPEALKLIAEANERREKGLALITYHRNYLGLAKIPRILTKQEIHEITPKTLPSEEEKKRSKQKPSPLKERLLILSMVLASWFPLYSLIASPFEYSHELATVIIAAVATAYTVIRIRRFKRER
jgi:hypothetical protein